MCTILSSLLGPHRHHSYKKDRRLPINANDSGESTSNDSGDHRQCPCPWPHWTYLLAIHKRGTRTQTQVSTKWLKKIKLLHFTGCLFLCNTLFLSLYIQILPPHIQQWKCECLLPSHCWRWWRGRHWLPSARLQWANTQVWFQHSGLGGEILLSWHRFQAVTVC